MKNPQIMAVLKAPVVTEKSSGGDRRYVFEVSKPATKLAVKQAVERVFKVQVDRVTTLNVKGKTIRRGQHTGKQKDWKKAYVVLKEGHHIDFTSVWK